MGLLGNLARGYALNRLLSGRRRPRGHLHGGYPGHGHPQPRARRNHRDPYGHSAYGHDPYARRGRFGLFGPVPSYSRRTRGGTRVSVGGCCLPIPLLVLGTTTTAAGMLTRRALRRR